MKQSVSNYSDAVRELSWFCSPSPEMAEVGSQEERF